MTRVYCLKVDLGAPVASSDPYIHLDGPLSYAAGIEAVGRDGLDEMDRDDDPEYFEDEMPLRKYEVEKRGDKEWVWAASAASVADPPEGIDRWNTTRWRKRFDDDPLHQVKETQINTTSGEFKSYNAALPYTPVDELQFFFEPAANATPEDVIDLLKKHVVAIGKKRSQGFGRISNLEYAEATDAVDSAIYHGGRVLRSLPEDFSDGLPRETRFEYRSTRPPYWHSENFTYAYAPFTPVDDEFFDFV